MSYVAPKVVPGRSGDASATILTADSSQFFSQSAQYGPQELLACGSIGSLQEGVVLVYEMNSAQLVQTLSGHSVAVTCVLWKPPPPSYLQHGTFLFSGDKNGNVFLWDVTEGLLLSSVQVPNRMPIRAMSLISDDNLLLVLAYDGSNYVYNSHLSADEPIETDMLPFKLSETRTSVSTTSPTTTKLAASPSTSFKTAISNTFESAFNGTASMLATNTGGGASVAPMWPVPSRFCTSKLAAADTYAAVLGDRVRVVTRNDVIGRVLLPGEKKTTTARDLIYDSEDGAQTVVDAFFSEAHEEVLYFCTRNAIGSYDWRSGCVLNQQIVWTEGNVEFRGIYPSSPGTFTALQSVLTNPGGMPLFYSFNSNQRLMAWYLVGNGRFDSVSVDVRGVRVAAKSIGNVVQCTTDPTLFAVLLEDGVIVRWRYDTCLRRWSLTNYIAAPLLRPTSFCFVNNRMLCCSLESGQIVLIDAMFNYPVKRFSLTYAGGTRIILLCSHRFEDMVWVVSDRCHGGKHNHQVSVVDTRSGEVVRILRKPSVNCPETCSMKDISMDESYTYVLLLFWNGTFEVWNTEDNRLVHVHSGLGLSNVSWAPQDLRKCLSGIQGSPQLLSVVFADGTLSLWSVYKDRIVVSRDTVPLFQQSSVNGGTVRSVTISHQLVFFDSNGCGCTLSNKQSKLAVRVLKDSLPGCGAAVSVAAPPPSRLMGSFAASFSSSDVETEEETRSLLVAAAFGDGSVGIWDAETGERVATSRTGPLRSVRVVSVLWLERSLVLRTTTGSVLIVDSNLSSVNSSVSAKALRRPIKTAAFLLPAQRTYLQTFLEICSDQVDAPLLKKKESSSVFSGKEEPETKSGAGPSAFIQHIALSKMPCRGPFGQLITSDVRTLRDELWLYQTSMIPTFTMERIREAAKSGNRPAVCFWVANFLGQLEKQNFWTHVELAKVKWLHETNGETPPPFTDDDENSPTTGAALLAHDAQEFVGTSYLFADRFSEALAPRKMVQHNHLLLDHLRGKALQLNHNLNVDDSVTRLRVVWDLIKLHEYRTAVDILLDSNYQSPHFALLSTLAVTIAACEAADTASAATGPAFLKATAKRAAALLLARGDVNYAVEKYILADEISEACMVLQSQKRWAEASSLLQLLPRVELALRQEVYSGWANDCLQRGYQLPSARLFLAVEQPAQVLRVLSQSSRLTDVAGQFALFLTETAPHLAFIKAVVSTPPPAATEGGGEEKKTAPACSVMDTLADYSEVLRSVSNFFGEAAIVAHVESLKLKTKAEETTAVQGN